MTPRYIGNDPYIKFSSIKSKEIQLKKYIEKLYNKYPKLFKKYYIKYNKKLNEHKFFDYFKDLNSINQIEFEIFDEYRDYIMNIQKELFSDVIKASHNKMYNIIFYISAFIFIGRFIYYFRKLIILTKNKIAKINLKNLSIEKQTAPNWKEKKIIKVKV